MVLVLLAGSAMDLSWAQNNVNAIVDAWYPGARGGKAIAEAGECVVEPGTFRIAIGGQQPDERSRELTGKSVDCFEVILNGETTKVAY